MKPLLMIRKRFIYIIFLFFHNYFKCPIHVFGLNERIVKKDNSEIIEIIPINFLFF